MSPILIQDALRVGPGVLRRWEAEVALPGEKVRLVPGRQLAGELAEDAQKRALLFGDRLLTVSAVRAGATVDGALLTYEFLEMAGKHNVQAFQDPRGTEHVLAAMLHREGTAWLVPMPEPGRGAPTAGAPMPLAEELPRSARFGSGIAEGEEAMRAFLARHEDDPSIGEFYYHPNSDGTVTLARVVWDFALSQDELSAAEEAIAEMALPLSPSP